ncbi:MAG: DPP IV N-terminal domain-containing protein [Planctomycetes bacterium]|nr:DPP IV N-terminal domain-containing protein [Planctomycetota bacterium]
MRPMPPSPFLLALLVPLAPAAAQGVERLAYADVRRPIVWQGKLPTVRWAADGVHVEIEDGKDLIWLEPASGARRPKPAGEAAAAAGPPRQRVLLHEGDLWLDEGEARGRGASAAKSERAVRLTDDAAAGEKAECHLAPGGAFASFVRRNDLFVVDAASRAQWRVTDDGAPDRFHGRLDWVYQEELYGRGDFQAHWWSPGGEALAFLSLDAAAVKPFTLVDHVPKGFLDQERAVTTEVSNYPKAGDPNPTASLSVAHLGTRTVVRVDLSGFPADALVVRVDWTPDGKELLATIQDRIQTWAELCAVDPATGTPKRWLREESATWVNRPESPRWLADGSFLWLSERTGRRHVYRYRRGGELVGAVTAGDWQVRKIERVDEAKGVLWFEGTKDGATGRHLYRIGLDGEGLVGVTPGEGTHAYELDAAGTYLIDRWSAMDRPPTVRLLDAATGAVVAELGAAGRGEAAAKYAFAERQRLSIPARDGYLLDACVQLPVDRQPGRRLPVFLPTYSGPDAPSVRDAWSHSTYHQFLCQQGFVVLQVNVRSASGRGQAFTGTCYRQLGVQELRDLEDAVDHVVAHFDGDPERVAISGWSYGGFMAAYALTHSKKFALGLAGAGVYDWRLYDTIYTERYMRTPQENQAGYDASSVIKAAKDLHGHLVILHGTLDDNVHVQNAMQLVWALQTAGRQDFELMLYPRSRHGLHPEVRAHGDEFQWRRLQRLLEPRRGG